MSLGDKGSRRNVTLLCTVTSDITFTIPQMLIIGSQLRNYEKRAVGVHYGIPFQENLNVSQALAKRCTFEMNNDKTVGICWHGSRGGNAHLCTLTYYHFMVQVVQKFRAYCASTGGKPRLLLCQDGAPSHNLGRFIISSGPAMKIKRVLNAQQMRTFVCGPGEISFLDYLETVERIDFFTLHPGCTAFLCV